MEKLMKKTKDHGSIIKNTVKLPEYVYYVRIEQSETIIICSIYYDHLIIISVVMRKLFVTRINRNASIHKD